MLYSPFILLATFVDWVGVQITTGRHAGPVVSLNYATFEGASTGGVDSFLGVPFAHPPVGNLRFRRPHPPLPLPGITPATAFGNACPQQYFPTLPYIPGLNYSALVTFVSKARESEDCLYANVYRPAGVTSASKLPVVVWFYGGAFQFGDGSAYDGTTVVHRSIKLGEPVIYVNFNYRVNAFGFLAGREALDAGIANNGLYDQKFFLTWLKTHVSKFGGDPDRITAWGQSAGAISITAHLVTNPVHPPFQAAILHSGFTPPIYRTDSLKNQIIYNHLVQSTGCSSALDTLECLRIAPYDSIIGALNGISSSVTVDGGEIPWGITIDGELIKKSLNQYVSEGHYARVPTLGGDVDDEGTLFTLYSQSIVTDADLKAFLKAVLFYGATDAQVNSVADQYSQDPAAGSPFGTGDQSVLTPQFKRLAAIQGDHAFIAGRRSAFSKWAATQNVWSLLWKRRKDLLYIGSFHGADLLEMYDLTGDHLGTDAIINFIYHHDPNHPKGSTAPSLLWNITWPKYTLDSKKILLFSDHAAEEYTTIHDTFRTHGMAAITKLQAELGL